MYRIFTLLCFLLLCLGGFSQGKLKGKVIDSTNGQPIEAVNLFNSTRHLGAYSNSKGVYTVSYDAQEDRIEISCVGYKTTSLTIKELSKNPDIKLIPITIELSSFSVNSEQSFTEIGCHNFRKKMP